MINEKVNSTRLVIYIKDVEIITGKSSSGAEKMLCKIRMRHQKRPGQYVTVKEFCEFTGIDEDSVCNFLRIIG